MSVPRILLITSNGAGMGHLTRLSAVALCGRDVMESTLFSMSVALPVATSLGLRGEYCPSVARRWMPDHQWHSYLRDRIVALVTELAIDVVAFDGVAPYPGIGRARALLPNVAFVWFRRGMWRPGVNTAQLSKRVFFDEIIEPGELAAAADRGATATERDAVRVPPITMLDAVTRSSRIDAAEELRLDPSRRTVLVTLGSGRLGDVVAPGQVVLDELQRMAGWQICVTQPDVALQRIPIDGGSPIIELAGVYPLARHFAAFDAAVSAAGYNAVHELVAAGIPTLFVPNPSTTTDDQLGRAAQLAREGLALSAAPDQPEQIRQGIRSLADDRRRAEITRACAALPAHRIQGGAARSAQVLVELAHGFTPQPPTLAARWSLFHHAVRELGKRLLGTRGTRLVRRLMRRAPVDAPTAKLRVAIEHEGTPPPGTASLLISADVDAVRIRNGGPVEHILSGTSQQYLQERRRIAAAYYDIVD